MKRAIPVVATCLGLMIPAMAQDNAGRDNRPIQDSRDRDREQNANYPDRIPAGTQIRVRNNSMIDVRDRGNNRVYTATVSQDVFGENRNVLIPRGSNAELVVTSTNNDNMAVDLESVTVRGHRYMVEAGAYNGARRGGIGENKRTGEYVGGGALLGTIVGAIAGGGKGAAIGALAGAGAGAGGEVLTHGKTVRVPAETVLTFRLEQPLELGRGAYSRDKGYDRDGNHYHDNYYNRDREKPQGQYPPQ